MAQITLYATDYTQKIPFLAFLGTPRFGRLSWRQVTTRKKLYRNSVILIYR